MTRAAIASIIVLAAGVVSAEPKTETKQLAETFASKLATAAGASANADTVKVGEHSLVLATTLEQTGSAHGKVAIGVGVTCTIDGKLVDALASGSVGIDASREAALVVAAEEWAMQYGKPIVDAMSARTPTRRVGGYKVYAGATGIRGNKPAGLEELDANLFRVIEPALATLISSKAGLHALSVTAVRNHDGSVDGEFRVDGKVSTVLKQRALQANWPSSKDDYMLKQYYVLVAD